jgi:hypothetical protein
MKLFLAGIGILVGLVSWLWRGALTAAPFESTIILGSKNDKTRTIRLKADPAVVDTYAEMVTAVTAFLVSLAKVSAGVVKSYTITGRAIEDAYNRPTSAEAEWRDTAQVVTEIEDQPLKTANLLIPMPVIGIFKNTAGPGMDEIDDADADLLEYIGHFQAAGPFTVSDGEKVGAAIRNGERLA